MTRELRANNDGFDQESTGCMLTACPFSPEDRLCNPVKVNTVNK